MQTIDQIQNYLKTIPPGEIFTTKQMLKYGQRRHVDRALYQLVLQGEIRRLTYGVFCLADTNQLVSPVIPIVLKRKCEDSLNSIAEIGPDKKDAQMKEVTYYTLGYSTSFIFQGQRIILKKISGRKFELSQTNMGRVLLALWLRGRKNVDARMVQKQMQNLSLEEKMIIRAYLPLLPGWLHDYIFKELKRMELIF